MDKLTHIGETLGGGRVAQVINLNGDHLEITTVGGQVEIRTWYNGSFFNFVVSREELLRLLLTPLMQHQLGKTLNNPNWYLT